MLKIIIFFFFLILFNKNKINSRPKPAKLDKETEMIAAELPSEFDWRNVSGVSYVSPIRNQGSCGSCYAFAASKYQKCFKF